MLLLGRRAHPSPREHAHRTAGHACAPDHHPPAPNTVPSPRSSVISALQLRSTNFRRERRSARARGLTPSSQLGQKQRRPRPARPPRAPRPPLRPDRRPRAPSPTKASLLQSGLGRGVCQSERGRGGGWEASQTSGAAVSQENERGWRTHAKAASSAWMRSWQTGQR